jgi:hypothetical protein
MIPFMVYDKLPEETLNACHNFLHQELLSTSHQIHHLVLTYRGTHNTLQEVIRVQKARNANAVATACNASSTGSSTEAPAEPVSAENIPLPVNEDSTMSEA